MFDYILIDQKNHFFLFVYLAFALEILKSLGLRGIETDCFFVPKRPIFILTNLTIDPITQ